MPKHNNDAEQKALHFIMTTGTDGVLQSELWRKLGASSREGSRIAIKLADKGLIRRERVLCNGRWTYKLFPKRIPASIESISDCPCLMCPDNPRCDPSSAVSPQTCDRLTDWIISVSNQDSHMGDS